MERLTIAIDGPSGAGKGTVARAVARALGYRHVDTGAMYRAVALTAVRRAVPLDDEGAVGAIAERAVFDLAHDRVQIDGQDVTLAIRTPEIDVAAARVARLPKVRAALVAYQRRLGGAGAVVEGRDIGTVVFPGAHVKIYLDATPAERARRRASDAAHASGAGSRVTDVKDALHARDLLDRTREASPLTIAADAVVIDTTDRPIDQVVAEILAIVRKRQGSAGGA